MVEPLKPGDVFERLTVVGKGEKPRFTAVKCSCGKELEVRTNNLRMGRVSSCGCLRSELAAERMRKRHAEG